MSRIFTLVLGALAFGQLGFAQVGGGSVYASGRGRGRASAEAEIRAFRDAPAALGLGTTNADFIDATVLLNVKADAYVAVFALSGAGKTVEECRRQIAVNLANLRQALRKLGVPDKDIAEDYVTQNRTYGYEVVGNVARQILTGFEVKRNVAVSYRNHSMTERLIVAAATVEVYDLVKVDYVVTDLAPIQTRLMVEAAKVVRRKATHYQQLLGLRSVPSQVVYEKYGTVYPTEGYEAYVAQESEDVEAAAIGQQFVVQRMRKPRTFYYQPLDAGLFDSVLNPIVLEPVVQFTLTLRVRVRTTPAAPVSTKPKRGAK